MRIAHLTVLLDEQPHGAALNMAIDEVLLKNLTAPTLRIYRWATPAVSFGYFTPIAEVENLGPARELVRRWTGGGVVPHGEDFTYTLLCPLGMPLTELAPLESYRVIHHAVATALAAQRVGVALAGAPAPKVSHACFENPAQFDILAGAEKVAGAAQRRTREGLLHQGSIQIPGLDFTFGRTLAGELSDNVQTEPFDSSLIPAAEALAATKYATSPWTRRF
ncbi:MAG: lipoate--protein ligase family protein [Chthoniobacteraceae bacterium]